MKNLDVLQQQKTAMVQKMQTALTSGDEQAFSLAFEEFAEHIAQQVMAQAEEVQQSTDRQVLASRGVRQLTNEERTYFEKLGTAMKSENPQQALTSLDVTMPTTTVNAVFDDLKAAHPLLDVIDFQNTSGLIEVLVNTGESPCGTWGKLTAQITEELASGFKKINLTLAKYTAFLPVAKSMLDLGPEWLESYVRTLLQETIYIGLEEAIIKGSGKEDSPIGMIRQVGEGVSVTGGEYPEKTPETVSALDPIAYGELLAKLAKTPDDRQRSFDSVIMVVSPHDYFTKVMPATTIRCADGTYVNNVMPFPTQIIQSVHIDEGKMIVGLPKRYFMGVGLGKSGKIEHSDHARFLEDERTYICKVYAHGEPKDNTSFIYCDISDLAPAAYEVNVTKTTQAVATSASGGKAVKA